MVLVKEYYYYELARGTLRKLNDFLTETRSRMAYKIARFDELVCV
jgi:hypothetical protein